jgi:NitT/TauT family transport system substrate-binding protein
VPWHQYRHLNPRQQLAVCLTAVLIAAGGCSGSEPQGQSVDQVTYVTGLGQTGREGFVYVAEAKGFFADEHIKVAVKPGQAGEFNLQQLRGGQAQFVAIEYAGAVDRAAKGQFDGLRCIEVLHAKTTAALMTLASSGIASVRDLPGKTVAQAPGSVVKTVFPAYAKIAGLDQAQINAVKWRDAPGTQLPQLLAAGRVDAVGQFAAALPTVSAAAKGKQVNVLAYGDVMGDLYGNVVVTRTDTDADLQRRFVRALARGLRYAVDNPEESGKIINAAVPTTPADNATAELRLLKPYLGSPRATPELVARSIALLQGIGQIQIPSTGLAPEQIFDFAVASSASEVAAR